MLSEKRVNQLIEYVLREAFFDCNRFYKDRCLSKNVYCTNSPKKCLTIANKPQVLYFATINKLSKK